MEFFKELRRRKVIRVAVVYVVTAWALIQVADVVAEPLRLPDWFSTAVIVLLALGFPVALGLAWALEVRPEGGSSEQAAEDDTAKNNADTDDESEPYLITRRSVAVLPLENISSDADVAHVATGLTEEILNHLSHMQDLKVVSRSSTLAYQDTNVKAADIGEELGVSYLVEGSIRKLGDDLRITAQLIRAPDDEHLWAQTFQRELSDGFAMQEQLAQVIARQVQANMQTDVSILAARRQTQNARAYRYFRIASEERWQQVSGNHSPDSKLVLENYRRAVELDPDFAAAHEGIANALFGAWFELDLSREEASLTAHEALERAMALRPPSAFTYLNLAQLYAHVDANYPAALGAIEKGLALAPNMVWLHLNLALLAVRQGHLSDALKHARTALSLSPGDGQTHQILGKLLWTRGDRTGAISELEKSLENMRGGFWFVVRTAQLAMVYLEDGQTERANSLLDAAMRSLQGDTAGLAALCVALAQAGRTSDLQTVTAELVSVYGEHWFPGRYEMHLAANELDDAFRYLNEGIEQRHAVEVMWLRFSPWLAPLREDPRWQDVMTHLEEMEARAAAGE